MSQLISVSVLDLTLPFLQHPNLWGMQCAVLCNRKSDSTSTATRASSVTHSTMTLWGRRWQTRWEWDQDICTFCSCLDVSVVDLRELKQSSRVECMEEVWKAVMAGRLCRTELLWGGCVQILVSNTGGNSRLSARWRPVENLGLFTSEEGGENQKEVWDFS